MYFFAFYIRHGGALWAFKCPAKLPEAHDRRPYASAGPLGGQTFTGAGVWLYSKLALRHLNCSRALDHLRGQM